MKKFFPAIVDKDPDSDFGISFPDFPGCVSAGDTPEEAIALGTEALRFHVAAMVRDGDALPQPTPLAEIVRDPEVNVVLHTLIPVVIPAPAQRINVTLPGDLLAEIDAETTNRSGFLADAAREKLARTRAA